MALDVSLEKDWKLVLPDRGFQIVGFWSCISRTDLLVSSSRGRKSFAFWSYCYLRHGQNFLWGKFCMMSVENVSLGKVFLSVIRCVEW